MSFLDFEQPIIELETKLEELRRVGEGSALDLNTEVTRLQRRCHDLTRSIFAGLEPWQIAQLARHPRRPHLLDYVERIFSDFQELHGDRCYADDAAIVAGLARLEQRTVMVIGQQKGKDTAENLRRNFGMPMPEGYRKARRLMRLAERFGLPVLTFIDTPGAYPGVGAEQRNQNEAISGNLAVMIGLEVPVITVITGEGNSGGALAIGIADSVLMQQYATYSVISPEGCASILWKSKDKAKQAASALRLTAAEIAKQGYITDVIEEPLGGAHRDPQQAADYVKQALLSALRQHEQLSLDELLAARYQRYMHYGSFDE